MKKLYSYFIFLLIANTYAFSRNVEKVYLPENREKATITATSWSDDFEDGAHIWWDNGAYSIVEENGLLKVTGNKHSKWVSFGTNLGANVDISANKVMNVVIRTGELRSPFTINAYVSDDQGNSENVLKKVTPSENFSTIPFEFTGTTVDFTKINSIFFAINGNNLTWNGEAWIQDIMLGDAANKLSYIAPIKNKNYYINSGSKEILITDIENAAGFSFSGGAGLVENVSFTPISNGMTTLTFDLTADATGEDDILITATGTSGYSDNLYQFHLVIDDNFAPTIDNINNIDAKVGDLITVELTGITDGDNTIDQNITVEATSASEAVTGPITVNYQQGLTKGKLSFTPVDAGENTEITISLNDGESTNNLTEKSFFVNVFESFNNPPKMTPVNTQSVVLDGNEHVIQLLGIQDGDDGTQTVSLSATSSYQNVIADGSMSVSALNGEQATLSFTPLITGITSVTITLTDDGGTVTNNGNATKEYTFDINVLQEPANGYVFENTTLSEDQANGIWESGSTYNYSYVDFDGYENITKIDFTNKSNWDGITMEIPGELDLKENPYISLDFYSVNQPMYFHIYFYDVTNDTAAKPANTSRNVDGAHTLRVEIPANEWTHVTFDYSGENLLLNKNGVDILIDRIDYLLLNMHPDNFPFPFTSHNGTVYIKNFKLGDKAEMGNEEVIATIDAVGDVGLADNNSPTPVDVLLTGISDGKNSRAVEITYNISNPSILISPEVSDINLNGEATFTFTPVSGIIGSSDIEIIVTPLNEAYTATSVTFSVDVFSNDPSLAANVSIDLSDTHQTWRGMGSMLPPAKDADKWSKEMGGTAFRLGMLGSDTEESFEMVNDNDDPNVIDLSAFNRSVHDWDVVRKLIDNGVETFYVTWWSPEDWMKDNLSVDMGGPGAEPNTDNTTNRLSYHMYDEFAEHVAAFCMIFFEETGMHLTAIGLQNEPVFHEPYGSAILDPSHFAELTQVVGDRLVAEGIPTQFGSPEQVISQNTNSMNNYIDAIQANASADQYTIAAATHGYAKDGVGKADVNGALWNSIRDNAQAGTYPKEVWLTETGVETKSWSEAIVIATGIYNGIVNGDLTVWMNFSSTGQLFEQSGVPTNSFYVYKHFTKFIRPGAVRIGTTESENNLFATTFLNEEEDGGNLVTVFINNGTTPKAIELDYSNGNVPDLLDVYTSQQNSKFKTVASGISNSAVIVIPALGITTVQGYNSANVVTVTVNNGKGSGNYTLNTVVNIEANGPAVGKGFYKWTGDVGYLNDIYSEKTELTVPDLASVSVTAQYIDLPKYYLTVIGGTQSGSGEYSVGETVTLTANDSSSVDLEFYSWTGDVFNVENIFTTPATLIMPASDVTITSTYQPLTSVDDRSGEEIQMYPNPVTNGYLTIKNLDGQFKSLVVSDVAGKKIIVQQLVDLSIINVNLSGLESGMYIISLQSNKMQINKTIIIE